MHEISSVYGSGQSVALGKSQSHPEALEPIEPCSGSMSRAGWKLSFGLADHCKQVIYHDINNENHPFCKILPLEGNLINSLTDKQNQLHGGDGDVNNGKPFTPREYRRQIIRRFLHIHKELMKPVCQYYMENKFQGKERNAIHAENLIYRAVNDEITKYKKIEKQCDRVFFDNMLEYEVIIHALDQFFMYLGMDVCLIRWCSEWCDELDMWTDLHGPLLALITPDKNRRLPSYTTDHGYCFKPPEYFGMDMQLALENLRPADLANIIKIRWNLEICRHNSYMLPHAITHRLKYDGIVADDNFMKDREWWLKKSKSENEHYQNIWTQHYPDTGYDRAENAFNIVVNNYNQIQRPETAINLSSMVNVLPDYKLFSTGMALELGAKRGKKNKGGGKGAKKGNREGSVCRRCGVEIRKGHRCDPKDIDDCNQKNTNGGFPRNLAGECTTCGKKGHKCKCTEGDHRTNYADQKYGDDGLTDKCRYCGLEDGAHTKNCQAFNNQDRDNQHEAEMLRKDPKWTWWADQNDSEEHMAFDDDFGRR